MTFSDQVLAKVGEVKQSLLNKVVDRLPGWAQKGTLVFPFFFLFVFIYKTITMSKIVITQEQLENLKKTLSENKGIVKEDTPSPLSLMKKPEIVQATGGFINIVDTSITILNNSKYFTAIMMLLLNLGSRYISLELSQFHVEILFNI